MNHRFDFENMLRFKLDITRSARLWCILGAKPRFCKGVVLGTKVQIMSVRGLGMELHSLKYILFLAHW